MSITKLRSRMSKGLERSPHFTFVMSPRNLLNHPQLHCRSVVFEMRGAVSVEAPSAGAKKVAKSFENKERLSLFSARARRALFFAVLCQDFRPHKAFQEWLTRWMTLTLSSRPTAAQRGSLKFSSNPKLQRRNGDREFLVKKSMIPIVVGAWAATTLSWM